jgi:hypothetical protein
MTEPDIKEMFAAFLRDYDEDRVNRIWAEQSEVFRRFWTERIIAKGPQLDDAEIDRIVRILDRNGKGNTKGVQAVAKAMVAQGAWRRLFKEIQEHAKLHDTLDQIFHAKDDKIKIGLIDKLWEINEGHKNNLTSQSGIVINAMLFAYAPTEHLSAISLKDRFALLDYFGLDKGKKISSGTPGHKVVLSNTVLINAFRQMGLTASLRAINEFLYLSPFKAYWKPDQPVREKFKEIPTEEMVEQAEEAHDDDPSRFSMESELENFLITNWEKTELGKKYDLVKENGELVSQQYQTGIGIIDILAKEKKTNRYVIIELKRGKTSDQTIGQLTRYMGWLEEHKTNHEPTKGIVIALEFDEKLFYAAKKIKDVEVYIYKVSFSLEEHKKR